MLGHSEILSFSLDRTCSLQESNCFIFPDCLARFFWGHLNWFQLLFKLTFVFLEFSIESESLIGYAFSRRVPHGFSKFSGLLFAPISVNLILSVLILIVFGSPLDLSGASSFDEGLSVHGHRIGDHLLRSVRL